MVGWSEIFGDLGDLGNYIKSSDDMVVFDERLNEMWKVYEYQKIVMNGNIQKFWWWFLNYRFVSCFRS